MLVVSDTSPISSLIQIDRAELLRDIFSEVLLPPAVHSELTRFHTTLPSFLEVRQIIDRPRAEALRVQLDLGEAEAIILALESKADQLLVDERRGRALAVELGVPIIGLLGVLLLARKQSLIPSVTNCIDQLQSKAGFYVSADVVQKLKAAAGEG